MDKFDVICFSTGYYDEKMWTNRQHLMSRLAQSQRVLYIEPGLFNKRYFRDLVFNRPWRLLSMGPRRINPNLWAYFPTGFRSTGPGD